jgi:hypothetical protein
MLSTFPILPRLEIAFCEGLPIFGLKTTRTGLVRFTLDLSSAFLTGLVRPVLDLSGTQQFCFQKLLTSSLLITSCPYHVIDLSFLYLVSGWTLVVRRGPSTNEMRSGPPSGVVLTRARHLCLVGLLLLHVTTLLTLAKRMRMIVRCLSSIHLLSGFPTWPFATLRRPSNAQSMKIEEHLCMRAANSPATLAFGHFFTRIGTVPSISTS